MPRVSVLMAHTGPDDWLGPALESLARQRLRDFEVIIVDDGANVDWEPRLRCLAAIPTRVVHNPRRLGLVRALNRGVRECSGELIARMDSDDVCVETRLEHQVAWLDHHPEIHLLGSAVRHIDAHGRALSRSYPITDPDDLALALLAYNQFAHGSVMVRSETLHEVGGYDEDVSVAQDYDVWLRMLRLGKRMANLSSAQYEQRVHAGSISQRRGKEQTRVARQLRERCGDLRPARLSAFFALRRDEPAGRSHESLQLGKLALMVGFVATRPGIPTGLRQQGLTFSVRHARDALQLLGAEGVWRRQWARWLRMLR